MKIAIASDHAGFQLKESLKSDSFLSSFSFNDLTIKSLEDSDYPDAAYKVVYAILNGEANFGILICGTGIGMSISANRFKNIRAALCHDVTTAHFARLHNDANILCMGGRITGLTTALDITKEFLNTSFDKGRHIIRLQKIENIATN